MTKKGINDGEEQFLAEELERRELFSGVPLDTPEPPVAPENEVVHEQVVDAATTQEGTWEKASALLEEGEEIKTEMDFLESHDLDTASITVENVDENTLIQESIGETGLSPKQGRFLTAFDGGTFDGPFPQIDFVRGEASQQTKVMVGGNPRGSDWAFFHDTGKNPTDDVRTLEYKREVYRADAVIYVTMKERVFVEDHTNTDFVSDKAITKNGWQWLVRSIELTRKDAPESTELHLPSGSDVTNRWLAVNQGTDVEKAMVDVDYGRMENGAFIMEEEASGYDGELKGHQRAWELPLLRDHEMLRVTITNTMKDGSTKINEYLYRPTEPDNNIQLTNLEGGDTLNGEMENFFFTGVKDKHRVIIGTTPGGKDLGHRIIKEGFNLATYKDLPYDGQTLYLTVTDLKWNPVLEKEFTAGKPSDHALEVIYEDRINNARAIAQTTNEINEQAARLVEYANFRGNITMQERRTALSSLEETLNGLNQRVQEGLFSHTKSMETLLVAMGDSVDAQLAWIDAERGLIDQQENAFGEYQEQMTRMSWSEERQALEVALTSLQDAQGQMDVANQAVLDQVTLMQSLQGFSFSVEEIQEQISEVMMVAPTTSIGSGEFEVEFFGILAGGEIVNIDPDEIFASSGFTLEQAGPGVISKTDTTNRFSYSGHEESGSGVIQASFTLADGRTIQATSNVMEFASGVDTARMAALQSEYPIGSPELTFDFTPTELPVYENLNWGTRDRYLSYNVTGIGVGEYMQIDWAGRGLGVRKFETIASGDTIDFNILLEGDNRATEAIDARDLTIGVGKAYVAGGYGRSDSDHPYNELEVPNVFQLNEDGSLTVGIVEEAIDVEIVIDYQGVQASKRFRINPPTPQSVEVQEWSEGDKMWIESDNNVRVVEGGEAYVRMIADYGPNLTKTNVSGGQQVSYSRSPGNESLSIEDDYIRAIGGDWIREGHGGNVGSYDLVLGSYDRNFTPEDVRKNVIKVHYYNHLEEFGGDHDLTHSEWTQATYGRGNGSVNTTIEDRDGNIITQGPIIVDGVIQEDRNNTGTTTTAGGNTSANQSESSESNPASLVRMSLPGSVTSPTMGIQGPTSIRPGESVQLTAFLLDAGGSVHDITGIAQFIAPQGATISNDGVLTLNEDLPGGKLYVSVQSIDYAGTPAKVFPLEIDIIGGQADAQIASLEDAYTEALNSVALQTAGVSAANPVAMLEGMFDNVEFHDINGTHASLVMMLSSYGIDASDYVGKLTNPYGAIKLFEEAGVFTNTHNLDFATMLRQLNPGDLVFFADPEMDDTDWKTPTSETQRNNIAQFMADGIVGVYKGNGIIYYNPDGAGGTVQEIAIADLHNDLRSDRHIPYGIVASADVVSAVASTDFDAILQNSSDGHISLAEHMELTALRENRAGVMAPGVVTVVNGDNFSSNGLEAIQEELSGWLEGPFAYTPEYPGIGEQSFQSKLESLGLWTPGQDVPYEIIGNSFSDGVGDAIREWGKGIAELLTPEDLWNLITAASQITAQELGEGIDEVSSLIGDLWEDRELLWERMSAEDKTYYSAFLSTYTALEFVAVGKLAVKAGTSLGDVTDLIPDQAVTLLKFRKEWTQVEILNRLPDDINIDIDMMTEATNSYKKYLRSQLEGGGLSEVDRITLKKIEGFTDPSQMKQVQEHHFLSNKHAIYTTELVDLLGSKTFLKDLDLDGAWNKSFITPHWGNHGGLDNAYHRWMEIKIGELVDSATSEKMFKEGFKEIQLQVARNAENMTVRGVGSTEHFTVEFVDSILSK